jgi:hypothetical protein
VNFHQGVHRCPQHSQLSARLDQARQAFFGGAYTTAIRGNRQNVNQCDFRQGQSRLATNAGCNRRAVTLLRRAPRTGRMHHADRSAVWEWTRNDGSERCMKSCNDCYTRRSGGLWNAWGKGNPGRSSRSGFVACTIRCTGVLPRPFWVVTHLEVWRVSEWLAV